ncbi:hypothetical protein C0J52_01420 [Blattella germanica]|nr:hypothetical protein C0J52_01420 [Blattella germanica]
MSVLNQSGEEQVECPLCLEPLEVDDLNFFPCTCGYQICRFCWHRIRTDENGLCPACRKAYSENPADFKPLSQEEVARLKAEKRHKDQQRKQKITENRKHLANIRVVQRNLVFVVGLPMRLADAEVLKKHEYFGKFGKIQKVVINQSTSYAGTQGPSASAYVTYYKADDALRAIQAVNNISVDGRTVKTSLGTTKYCSHFMKNQACPKPDCMYLHELGDVEASFTKEEMQQGKHQEYEKKLHEQLFNTYNNSALRDRKPTPSPPAVTSSIVSCNNVYPRRNSSTSPGPNSCSKEAWPSLQSGLTAGNFGLAGNNGINSNTTKGECSQRKRIDQQTAKHKKRHASGEENRGKTKEKSECNVQDELGTKPGHNSNPNVRPQDFCQNSNLTNNSSSSSMSELTNGPPSAMDLLEVQENENLVSVGDSCTVLGTNGRSQINGQNSGRLMVSNHRATLFEPDNNSFFSTNNFTKVAATNTGSGTTDWSISGLALTHMPDVLPPVHSSEDWQAAFGFANSSGLLHSQHQETNCVMMPSELTSQVDSNNIDHGFVQSDQQHAQTFQTNLGNKSPILENASVFPSAVTPSLSEDYRQNTSCNGHLPHKAVMGNAFTVDEVSNVCLDNGPLPLHPNISSNCGTNTHHMFAHPPFLQDGTIVMMHPQPYHVVNHVAGSQLIVNGPSHVPNSGKFLTDFHLRQQQSQNLINNVNPQTHFHNHSTVFENHNLSRGNFGNLTNVNSFGSNFSLGSDDFNGGECKVESEGEHRNGDCISDEKYLPSFLGHQQKNLESNIEYNNREVSSKIHINSPAEKEEVLTKDNGRLTDDELGFDPFHETQKALAEMMENENLQNKQPSSHGPHNQQIMANHLTQQLYQQSQLNQMNHVNHQLPPGSLFTNNNNSSSSFNSSNQHIQRLPANISSCTKLLDGLSLGPSVSSIAQAAPTRSRLPPPGFTTAPNHMNAFGLGIPRAPTNSGSKILPFMGLGNGPSSTNNGASSPIPQTVPNLPNNLVHPQPVTNPTSMMFSSTGSRANNGGHTFGLQNGIVNSGVPKSPVEPFHVNEWTENMRPLLPTVNSSSHNVQFMSGNAPTPPPSSLNVFGAVPVHGNTQKVWSGIGPCSDWTALDPAIVSSSCQPNYLSATSNHPSLNSGLQLIHNPNLVLQQNAMSADQQNSTSPSNPMTMSHLHKLQQNNTGHWLRSLPSEESIFYSANVIAGSSTDWAANISLSNAGTVQPQQNHMIESPNSGSVIMAPPPPGFSTMRLPVIQPGTLSAKSKNAVVNTEVRNIENINQTEGGIIDHKEEEGLR